MEGRSVFIQFRIFPTSTTVDITVYIIIRVQSAFSLVASCVLLEIKQATFLSTRTAAGSKLRRYRWRMMATAVLV